MAYTIEHLPKERWQGYILPMRYTSDSYYDVRVDRTADGFAASFRKTPARPPIEHTPEEYDFPDRLYAEYYEGAFAWGIVRDKELLAAIETCPETWSNRLRVTELWVAEELRGQGIGRALLNLAKEQAGRERRRAVILETQSCNANAIGFYLHEGLTLTGFDACCYRNDDLDRKEVRLELGWFRNKPERLSPDKITVREERPEEWFETEAMTRRAFWNRYRPGCDEHFLVHKLRSSPAYRPELSRVAVVEGRIVGCILYSESQIRDGAAVHPALTFGPLCVDPAWQGRGIGERLLGETLPLAAGAGYPGVVIYGEPDYYPRLGFRPCGRFGITTPEGETSDAFMAIELVPGGLADVHGTFYEAAVFHDLPPEAAAAYDRRFPPLEKQRFPGQWAEKKS